MSRELPAAELVAGRYQLLRRVGQGGSGEVFVAKDESTGQQVALKRQLPEREGTARAMDLMREYHALSGLRHPRIIEVYDCGVDGRTPYYTMELLEGRTLSELAPLPYREACSHLRDAASSLALLHDRRLLHRDVSPRNLLRTNDGRCKLIDFGAMIPFGTPPNIAGTPSCIAPEVLQGGPLDHSSDLYSLGAAAYFTVTGRHAFPAHELSALPALWRQRVAAIDGIPDALRELVMSLLSLDPAQRPTSAAEVIDRLSAIADLPHEDNLAIGRSYLASSPLLGRARERALLSAVIANAKNGQGSALWVTGEAGSGRTRMLSEASLIAQTSGLLVVRIGLREQRGFSSTLLRDLVTGLMKVAPKEAQAASDTKAVIQSLLQGQVVRADQSELLGQVGAYVGDISAHHPLLLTFDDVQHGSDSDKAVIAALAHHTRTCALCVVASERGQKEAAGLANVSDLARPLHLKALDRAHTAILSSALFGNVPNLTVISDFLFRNAQGNPKMTLQLAEVLLQRGTVRYVAGRWVLPDEISDAMPRDMAQTLMLRLSEVSADARGLVDVLCVRRRGASAEQLIAIASSLPTDRVFQALEELVRTGVLESAGYEYAFVQEALRVELSRSLTPERSQELHRRWAEHLLSRSPNQDERLEAGWHLVHTPDELRGAELLAEVAPKLLEQRMNMASAIPAVERALDVYERHDRSLSTRLYLRSLLVLSSYLYDFRLAERYATETLDLLYPLTGLPEVERFARWIGKRWGFVIGMLWAMLRWMLRPSGPHVFAALKYYTKSALGLLGLRALALDDTGALVDRLRGLEGVPETELALIYDLARAIHLHAQGRGTDARHAIVCAWSKLPNKNLRHFSAHDHVDLRVGMLLLEGVNECWRERSRALQCADALELIGTPLAIASSLRIRMMYFLLRGEATLANNYRRLLELKAVESGSLWQVQWMSVPLEGLAASTWHDLVGMRRALERYDQLLLEVPSLFRMRQSTLTAYYFNLGDYEAAAASGDDYIVKFPPRTRIGWPSTYGITALAHAHLRRYARALEICEHALAHVTPDDREYFVFYSVLDAAYATALALTGQRDKSAEVFRERTERMRAAGEHLRAMVMHHYRLRLARLLGDEELLRSALADMHDAAAQSKNPAAPALAQRLSEERNVASELPFEVDLWSDRTEPSATG